MNKNGLVIFGLLFSIIFSTNTNMVLANAQTVDDEYTTHDGLGCGIDAKTTQSIAYSDLIYSHSIFNDKIEELRRENLQTNEYYSVSNISTSLKSMTAKLSNSYQLGADFSINELNLFSNAAFGKDDTLTIEQIFNSYYYYRANIRVVKLSYFYNVDDTSFVNRYLSTNFKNRLNTISGLTGTRQNAAIFNLFKLYGTHVIVGGGFGGLYQAAFRYSSSKSIISSMSEIQNSFDAAFTIYSGFTDLNLDIVKNMNTKFEVDYLDGSTNITSKIIALKGTSLEDDTYETDQESTIRNWYESIDRDSCVYVKPNSNGILPIWSFITDSSLADKIENVFKTYVKGDTTYSDNIKYQARHDGDIKFGPSNNNYALNFKMPYSPMLIECGYKKIYFKMSLYLWTLNQLINNLDVYISIRNKNDISLAKKTIHMIQKNAKIYTFDFDVINLTEESIGNSINFSNDTYFDIKVNFDVQGQFFQTHGASKIVLDLEYRK